MTSLRDNIVAAVVANLGAISVAEGFNTNIATGAGGGGCQTPSAEGKVEYDPLPCIHVYYGVERKKVREIQYWVCDMELEVVGLIKPDGVLGVEVVARKLVEDIERKLFAQKNAWASGGTPYSLAYVEDVLPDSDEDWTFGHELLTRERDGFDGCRMLVVIRYRHNVADPRAYGSGG